MSNEKAYKGSCFCGAAVHVHYQETKLRIKDGLPKMKDVPKEMGGSGVSVAE